MWVSFSMIESVKKKEEVRVVIVCKDARNLVLVGNDVQNIKSFYQNLQELLYPKTLDSFFAFELGLNHENMWRPLYDARAYFVNILRKCVSDDGQPTWFISDLNKDYELSPTYPAYICLPWAMFSKTKILQEVAKFRSRGRIPCLCWMHASKPITITRCAQPSVGLTLTESTADRELVESIRASNPLSETLYVIDARPKVNAIGNVIGPSQGGYELGYEKCIVKFLNIENIHVVRESWSLLRKLITASIEDTNDELNWTKGLEETGWLRHVRSLLLGAHEIAKIIEKKNSSVLIHCSDGWDRTAQLSSLSQILLDPYYRTIKGFVVLIEKEWVSFGHKFQDRIGHFPGKKAEQSPIFLQWLDAIWQIMSQVPHYFEFNEEFLISVADGVYNSLFGTFLTNCERERRIIEQKTVSFWGWVKKNRHNFKNPLYLRREGTIWHCAKQRVLKLWENYWLRWDPYHKSTFLTPILREVLENYEKDNKMKNSHNLRTGYDKDTTRGTNSHSL
eukprot:TRINITY_DN11865_c0_g1_i1.p1 TRINITY_DN11865_c0_g1~~TRINITY_DN11865_c0_g1_i1.p1  ORF type:complete len:584 (-),score=49.41 TRINITY_DN11865_c0_g1_i1:28-1545(-)